MEIHTCCTLVLLRNKPYSADGGRVDVRNLAFPLGIQRLTNPVEEGSEERIRQLEPARQLQEEQGPGHMVRKRKPWGILGSECKRQITTPIVHQLETLAKDYGTSVASVSANIVKRWLQMI